MDKILSNDKIKLRVPINAKAVEGPSGPAVYTNILNAVVDVPENVITEWRQVIQAE